LAARAEESVLQNLIQFYTHDFSEFWAGTDKGDLLPDARFALYPLEAYWDRPHWFAHLLWHDDALAGCALINDHAHSGKATEHSVAEFFVLRKHRGQGVGRDAFLGLLARYPGTWEVAVARRNAGAISFWEKTLTGAAAVRNLQRIDVKNDGWNGPAFRFEVPGEPAK
jgi:predicted acetyltransferase